MIYIIEEFEPFVALMCLDNPADFLIYGIDIWVAWLLWLEPVSFTHQFHSFWGEVCYDRFDTSLENVSAGCFHYQFPEGLLSFWHIHGLFPSNQVSNSYLKPAQSAFLKLM